MSFTKSLGILGWCGGVLAWCNGVTTGMFGMVYRSDLRWVFFYGAVTDAVLLS